MCVVGIPALAHQGTIIDAAEAAGVRRFILNDFGWGPNPSGLPEFDAILESRKESWGYAEKKAEANPDFTWTGISIGGCLDWVS